MDVGEARIDERLEEQPHDSLATGQLLSAMRDENHFPLTFDVAWTYIRAAYGKGYYDALADGAPLTEEVPMLRHPEYFLP